MRLKIDPPETVGQTPTQRPALAKPRIAER
jgi:hypothetical protein